MSSAFGSRFNAIRSRKSLAEDAALATSEIVERATATIQAGLCDADAKKVWAAVGLYLERQVLQLKTVKLDAFGDFGVDESSEPVFRQDPVFLQTTRLRLASRKNGGRPQFGLPTNPELVEGVNLAELTAEHLPTCSKAVAHSVIASVLAWVNNWAKEGRKLQLDVLPLGEWLCDGYTVEFRFSGDFRQQWALRAARTAVAESEASTSADKQKSSGHNEDNNHSEKSPEAADTASADCASVSDVISAAMTKPTRKQRSSGLLAPTLASLAKQRGLAKHRRAASSSVDVSQVSRAWLRPRQAEPPRKSTTSENVLPANTTGSIAGIHVKKPGPRTTNNGRDGRSLSRSTAQSRPSRSGIVDRIRSRLSHRREHSSQDLNALSTALSAFEVGAVLPRELSLVLRQLGAKVPTAEMKALIAEFPHQKRGHISANNLLCALRGPPLSAKRLDLVARAFHRMDPECSGVASLDVLAKHYDVSYLPGVRAGTQSRRQALSNFLQEWKANASSNDNKVTFEAFVEYYHNVSAFIDEDSAFEKLMRLAWHASKDGHKPSGDSTHAKELPSDSSPVRSPASPDCPSELSSSQMPPLSAVESADAQSPLRSSDTSECAAEMVSPHESTESWTYLQQMLLLPRNGYRSSHAPMLDDLSLRLSANRILGDGNETMNVKAFAHALMSLDKRLQTKKALALAQSVAEQCADPLGGPDTIELVRLYHVLKSNESVSNESSPSINCGNSVMTQACKIVQSIRSRVLSPRITDKTNVHVIAGPLAGLDALERSLEWASSSHDKRLSKQDLRFGLRKLGIDISFHDLDYLFAHFDVNRQGWIGSEVVLEALRGPTSHQRLALIHKAFDLIAGDESNAVTLARLTAAYDSRQLPDVVNGTITSSEATDLFGLQWGFLDPDSIVSRDKFEAHFKNASAAMASDAAFEAMMRGIWWIPSQWTWLEPSPHVPTDASAGAKDLEQTPSGMGTATDRTLGRRRKQPASPSQQRNFHRQSLVHRAIWEQSKRLAWFQWEEVAPAQGTQGARAGSSKRARRDEAAQRIQVLFRGFRSRRVAMQLRRQAVANRRSLAARLQERGGGKKVVTRPALGTAHGF